MDLRGVTCAIEPFSAADTAAKSRVDAETLANLFHSALDKGLSRSGLVVRAARAAAGPSEAEVETEIEGDFVRFDEGSRWQRYFLTFISGGTAVEVEGRLYHRGALVAELYTRTSQGVGIFGGNGKKLLRSSASAAGRSVARQVIEALRAR